MPSDKEKDLSSKGEAARCAPCLKGLFCFLKTPQTPENTGFSCPQRVYHAYLLNALKRGFKRPPPTMPIRGLAGVKIKKEIAILFSQDYNFFLGFALVYRWNPLILGQFPCFFGIFHIKSLVWSIFLNYPENLQLSFQHFKKTRIWAKEKTEEGAAKRTPFLPPQLGHISLLRKPGKLG